MHTAHARGAWSGSGHTRSQLALGARDGGVRLAARSESIPMGGTFSHGRVARRQRRTPHAPVSSTDLLRRAGVVPLRRRRRGGVWRPDGALARHRRRHPTTCGACFLFSEVSALETTFPPQTARVWCCISKMKSVLVALLARGQAAPIEAARRRQGVRVPWRRRARLRAWGAGSGVPEHQGPPAHL